jgi:hypothetical protein
VGQADEPVQCAIQFYLLIVYYIYIFIITADFLNKFLTAKRSIKLKKTFM